MEDLQVHDLVSAICILVMKPGWQPNPQAIQALEKIRDGTWGDEQFLVVVPPGYNGVIGWGPTNKSIKFKKLPSSQWSDSLHDRLSNDGKTVVTLGPDSAVALNQHDRLLLMALLPAVSFPQPVQQPPQLNNQIPPAPPPTIMEEDFHRKRLDQFLLHCEGKKCDFDTHKLISQLDKVNLTYQAWKQQGFPEHLRPKADVEQNNPKWYRSSLPNVLTYQNILVRSIWMLRVLSLVNEKSEWGLLHRTWQC